MTQLIRSVVFNASFIINRTSYGFIIPVRTVFSSSGIGLDNFKLAREQHVSRHAPSIDGFKKRFLQSIDKSDSPIFTEDLRNMIMSADSDEEVHGVIQALKKYNTNKLKFTDYHFGSPIMRLLYVRNKPELAMELFMDESLKDVFRDSGSALILLNKLVEDQRYDDAIKVFEFASQRGFSTASGRAYPTDVVMLTIEALYRQNTKKSLEKAKELISKVMESNPDINPRTASMLALLAVEQGEPSFAMEILGAVRGQNITTIQNIRAICYATMGRVEEAINVVHLLADQPPIDDDRRRVFPLVLKHIEKAVEKLKDQDLQSRFEDLSKFVSTNNRLSNTDLSDFLNEPIHRRGAILPNRQGAQQGLGGTFQRTGGNSRDMSSRGGFNQQSNNSRQGTGGYMRNNRDQSDRFGNDRYQRHSFSDNTRFSSSIKENSFQQANQSSLRSNREENTAPIRSRSNEQNASRRNEPKVAPIATTSTSPIPQRSTQKIGDAGQPSTRSRTSNKSSSNEKEEVRQTGGNTGIQEQSPWEQPVTKSS